MKTLLTVIIFFNHHFIGEITIKENRNTEIYRADIYIYNYKNQERNKRPRTRTYYGPKQGSTLKGKGNWN